MPVHVSIHDVSPAWADEVDAALEVCARVGARPALLVVPDLHGRAPIARDERFCGRLRHLQSQGHEVYLHGYYHRAPGLPDRSNLGERVAWTIAQRVKSAGEAELAASTEASGQALIDEGEAMLRTAGLRIDGFVAPAWSMPSWLLPALGARGYRFTEDHLRIYDPSRGRARTSVLLNWASRSPARLLSSAGWCRLARHARLLLPARIAIHPADLRVLLLRREIERALAWAHGDFVERGASLLD